MNTREHDGIVDRLSNHTVDETTSRLQTALEKAGVRIFALIDHSGEAAKAELTMRPTKLLIFGNPKAGTPLMLAAPSVAIDLPLKVLVWEDEQGKTWISYNSSDYLLQRHHLPAEMEKNIAVVATLVERISE
jgi:uncharacterized protein (DUF302 family)